jgi:hypothetical protein
MAAERTSGTEATRESPWQIHVEQSALAKRGANRRPKAALLTGAELFFF